MMFIFLTVGGCAGVLHSVSMLPGMSDSVPPLEVLGLQDRRLVMFLKNVDRLESDALRCVLSQVVGEKCNFVKQVEGKRLLAKTIDYEKLLEGPGKHQSKGVSDRSIREDSKDSSVVEQCSTKQKPGQRTEQDHSPVSVITKLSSG